MLTANILKPNTNKKSLNAFGRGLGSKIEYKTFTQLTPTNEDRRHPPKIRRVV
jgi:hypothetical protein